MMKKKTKFNIMLTSLAAIALAGSVLAGGTYALFTSEAKTNIAVNSGNVKVVANIVENSLLTYSGENLEGNSETDTIKLTTELGGENGAFINGGTAAFSETDASVLNLDKMTPGDKVTFKIAIINYSNVKTKYRTKVVKEEDNGLYSGLKFDIGGMVINNSTAWKELDPTTDSTNGTKVATYTCSVELPSNVGNEYMIDEEGNAKSCSISYVVEAIQGNALTTVDAVYSSAEGNLFVNQENESENATISTEQTLSDGTMSVTYPEGTVLNTTEVSTGDDGEQKTTAYQKLEYVSNSSSEELQNSGVQIESTQAVAQYDLTLPLDESNTTLVAVKINYTAGLIGVKIYHKGYELPSSATEGEEYAEYNSDTGVITLYLKSASPIDIIYYKPNSAIDDGIFRNAWELQSDPTIYDEATKTLTIPEGIKYIDWFVFYKDGFDGAYSSNPQILKVEKLVLPNSLEIIGGHAFYAGLWLTEVEWPKNSNIKEIYTGAFNYCSALKEITLPDGIEYMSTGVFANCSSLEKVSNLPASVIKDVPKNMFTKCPLVVSKNDWLMKMETVGNNAFDKSFKDGEKLDLTNSPLTSIGKEAFKESKLKEVVFPSTLKTVGAGAFNSCKSLINVTLAASNATYEGMYEYTNSKGDKTNGSVFSYCSMLETLVIPEGCTNISSYMFYKCSKLTEVKFPKTLEKVGDHAFVGCGLLKKVSLAANATQYENEIFRGCTSIEEVVIPEGCTMIGDMMFYYCGSKLTKISFPSTLTTIKDSAFFADKNNTVESDIFIPSNVQVIEKNAFRNRTGIRCATPEKPDGWVNDWCNKSVTWKATA